MSQDFKTVKVLDDRLIVTDEISYAVIKGAQNNTVSRYPAIAKSTSQLVFNVQVPSEQTLIDRRVLIHNTWRLRLAGNAPVGGYLINVGSTDALAPFPCSQAFSTIQSTINNNTVNVNMQDVINALLRSNDQRELFAFNGTTPTAFDTYQSYSDALLANNNPLGSYVNVSDNDLQPRGGFNITFPTTGLPGDSTGNTINTTGAPIARVVYIDFETAEPIMCSPWLFADPKCNSQAIYGVTNLNFTFNLSANANRVWRSANAYITNAVVYDILESELIFTFLTPHVSDLMSARNCIPYYEVPRYITAASALGIGSNTIVSNTLQLNQVPDKLIIFVRPKLSGQTVSTPDYFLPITGIKINWNNQSGLLSNATVYDLYRYSRKAGSNQTWQEFSGYAWKADPAGGNGNQVNTSGSILMLNMGEAVQITEDWYAPSSIGNFNLQFELSVDQNTGAAADFELVLITINSGVMVTERGSTSIFTAVLDKQTVLDASQKEAYSGADVKRMVGGGFLDSLKAVAGKVLPKALPLAKSLLGNIDNPYAKAGSSVLGALGYGRSGGGRSGGGRSGGGRLKKYSE